MALVLKDRIKETSNTTGQGTLTLTGAVDGFRTFADIGNTNTTYYCITDGNNFEVGIGTYTASGTTLARTTVLQTSAGNTTKISCTGNQKVFVTQPASKAAYLDASNELVVNNTPLSTIQQRWTKTASSNQTAFSGAADSSGPTLAVNSTSHVFLNGIFLKETTDYALSGGTTVTLTAGATLNDIVEVITFTPLTTATTGITSGKVPVFTSGVADNDFLKIDGTTVEGRSASEVLSDIGGQSALTFGISSGNVPTFTNSVADNDFLKIDGTTVEGRSAAEVLSDIGGQASLTFGIANTNAVKVDHASVADNDYAKFTSTGVEGRSAAEVRSDLNVEDGATANSAGNAITISSGVINHTDTSSQASSNNSGRTYIQDITLDTYGHVTGLSTATETVTDTNTTYTGGTNISLSGTTFNLDNAITVSTSVSSPIFYTGVGSQAIKPNGNDLEIRSQSNALHAYFANSGYTYLYHNGSYTFRTEADGARVVNASNNNDGILYLGNTYGYIYNDMSSQISIYNGSNDAVIIGTHNSYTYLYFNGSATARTLSTGFQVFDSGNNDDGYLYIGDNGTTYIRNDEDSGFGILNNNDWVLWNDNNAHTYLYYNGSYTMRTLSDGIQINNTAYANSNLAWNYNGSTHHTLTSNNSNNPHMKGSATGSAGLLITDSAGNTPTQLYANAAGYGFLDSAWGSWDIQKVPNGNLYLNGNGTYYLNPASWSTVYDVNIIRNLSLNGSNGTAGQVLQTNGANVVPTWVDAGGGAWSLVSKSTISNANTVNYTVSAGVWYRFIMWGVTMASSQLRLALQLSSDGGSSMAYWCHTSFEIYNSSASTSNVITEHAYIDHIKLTEQYLKLANTGNGVNYNGNVFEVNYYQPTSGSGEECRVWGYTHGYGTQRRREFFRCHVINTQNNINYLRFVNENKTTASAWNLYGQWNLYKMEP